MRGADVRYVLVGGFNGTVLGSPRTTIVLDIVYARDADNLARVVRALEPLSPYLRGAPPGLPFRLDVAALERMGIAPAHGRSSTWTRIAADHPGRVLGDARTS